MSLGIPDPLIADSTKPYFLKVFLIHFYPILAANPQEMTQDGVIIKIPGALLINSRKLFKSVLSVHIPRITTLVHGLRTVSLTNTYN